MAKGKKTGGKDWQPGVSANPAGRAPLPPEVKEARRLNKTELETIVNKYLWEPNADLEKTSANVELPPVERWLVSIIHRGLSTGEWHGFEWIAQRLIGKVKDQVEITVPKPFLIKKANGETAMELGVKLEGKDDASD